MLSTHFLADQQPHVTNLPENKNRTLAVTFENKHCIIDKWIHINTIV